MKGLITDSAAGFLESPGKTNRRMATAWERFVATGQFGLSTVRPVIADGWLRCRHLGISHAALRAPSTLEMEQIERILATASLGIAGREVLQSYELFLQGSGHVLVLADAHGHILYSTGQRDTREKLERINFMPGGYWAEDAVGPNGVGTPIKLGRPEVILGTEHFCQGWQPWVCYGSPVRDPESGEIIGVVDITGPVRQAHIETLALIVAIAQAVEQRLQLRELSRRDQLHTQFLELEQRWPNDGLVLLSRSGRVLDANPAAVGILAKNNYTLRNRRLVDISPELARGLHGLRVSRDELVNAIEREIDAPLHLRLRLEALKDLHGKLAGYFLLLCKRETPLRGAIHAAGRTHESGASSTSTSATAAKTLRATEDEAIRRTLEECGGEISRAARRLGIARSTLYRRLHRRQRDRS